MATTSVQTNTHTHSATNNSVDSQLPHTHTYVHWLHIFSRPAPYAINAINCACIYVSVSLLHWFAGLPMQPHTQHTHTQHIHDTCKATIWLVNGRTA